MPMLNAVKCRDGVQGAALEVDALGDDVTGDDRYAIALVNPPEDIARDLDIAAVAEIVDKNAIESQRRASRREQPEAASDIGYRTPCRNSVREQAEVKNNAWNIPTLIICVALYILTSPMPAATPSTPCSPPLTTTSAACSRGSGFCSSES